jgi:hypothetical protein
MLNFKHLSNKNLFLILLLFFIFQIVFEIILFDDLLLPNKDTILEFELTRNYILFNKPFYSFVPNSSVYIDKFDFFTFYSIYLNKFFFNSFLGLNLNLTNFITFEISKKIFLLGTIFYFFLKILKKKNQALLCALLILIDGSFSHSLHNIHLYLIIFIILCLMLYTEQKFIKNFYIKIFLLGLFLTLGSLSIVSTGLVIGLTSITFLLINLINKKISYKIFSFFIFGSLLPIIFFFYTNFETIQSYQDLILNFRVSQNNQNIKYFITATISNLFYLLFGQHGNNFLTIYLIILLYNRKQFTEKFDIYLLNIVKTFLISFLIIGTLLDPLHYYPSRIGIITPIIIFLLTSLIIKKKLIYNKNLVNIIFFLLVAGLIQQLSNFNYHPNTTLKSTYIASISLIIFLFFYYTFKNLNYLIFFFFAMTILLKFFPFFKHSEIQYYYDNNKRVFIEETIKKISNLKKYKCLITNHSSRELFKTENFLEIRTSGEHLNKKKLHGNIIGGCDILILILDKKKNDFNIIKKTNFIKKNIIKDKFEKKNYFIFRKYYYKIVNTYEYKNLSIYFAERSFFINNINNNQIYLSID